MVYPQIIHFNRIFHCKPSIWGYLHLWKAPFSTLHGFFPNIFGHPGDICKGPSLQYPSLIRETRRGARTGEKGNRGPEM